MFKRSRPTRHLPWIAACLAVVMGCSGDRENEAAAGSPPTKPNVLIISVDDLRPELGIYGNTEIRTPHIDELAKSSLVFNQAFAQAAACAPSRAAFFLGQRPETTQVWSLGDKFREINPDAVTMPQHFARHGYHTVSIGKVFHNHMPDRISFHEPDLRPARYNTPELIDREPESFYHSEELKAELAVAREKRLAANPNAYAGGWVYGRSTESYDAPNSEFYDGAQTELALDVLRRLKDGDKPFYLALGYYRPHLPFVAPKKYWDLYDRDGISLATSSNPPADAPFMSMNSMYELRDTTDLAFVQHTHTGFRLPEEDARRLKHGYYASVSFIDALIGQLMAGLRDLGLDRNTIVVLWGDHGWKLGEHGGWAKQTNYLIDSRVPLLIRLPSGDGAGKTTDSPTELIDIFPTLTDLAGIEPARAMAGTSLRRLFAEPGNPVKPAAFSHYVRRAKNSPDGNAYIGYSMAKPGIHFVEWREWNDDDNLAGDVVATELYDLESDPGETVNVSGNPERSELVTALAEELRTGWPATREKSR